MTTGTGGKHICQYNISEPSILQIPGGVTNTSGTSVVPAGLVTVALYVPVVAVVAVIMTVKLKEVVSADELEQGLPMVYTSLWLMLLPFTIHCTVGQ